MFGYAFLKSFILQKIIEFVFDIFVDKIFFLLFLKDFLSNNFGELMSNKFKRKTFFMSKTEFSVIGIYKGKIN